MPGFNETNTGTFVASAALVYGRFVTINSSRQLAYTAAGGNPHGVVMRDAAIGDTIPIRFVNAGGSVELTASAAIAAGAQVYCAASGQISTTVSGEKVGVALEAATAAGDIIEVLLNANQI